ncbi:MAG TPA: hypothetical protein VGE20_04245 [Ramlibacter sp.]
MLFATKPLSKDVTGAAEEARRVTTHALEKAGELAAGTTRKVRAGLEDASATAQYQLDRYGRLSRRFVAERPLASALIAAAAGAAVVAVALALLRNRRDRQARP